MSIGNNDEKSPRPLVNPEDLPFFEAHKPMTLLELRDAHDNCLTDPCFLKGKKVLIFEHHKYEVGGSLTFCLADVVNVMAAYTNEPGYIGWDAYLLVTFEGDIKTIGFNYCYQSVFDGIEATDGDCYPSYMLYAIVLTSYTRHRRSPTGLSAFFSCLTIEFNLR